MKLWPFNRNRPKTKPVPGQDNLMSGAIDVILLFGCALAVLYIYKLAGGQ